MARQPNIIPVTRLASDVNCFWILEQDQHFYNNEDVLPDSYSELVIVTGAPMLLETERGPVELPRAFLNPIQNKPLRFRATGYSQLLAMQLYPWGVKPVLNINADPSSVHVIGLDSQWQQFALTLAQIVTRRGYGEAIHSFQDYVCTIAYQGKHDLTPIRKAGQSMRRAQGQIRMTDLASQSYLSFSQFERQFKQYTAVSPKTYARLVRFEAVSAALILEPTSRLAALASDYGFSDQAHLIREFRSFATCTPGDFAANASNCFDLQKYEHWGLFQKQSLQALPAP